MLEGDIAAVKTSRALTTGPRTRVIVSGKEPLATALADAFREDGSFAGIETFTPPEGCFLSGYGAFSIARERGEI